MTLPADDNDGLFPPFSPFQSGHLAVGEGHEIYWEQSGNPDGPPVVFLHGGPGGMAAPVYRRFFDPAFWRIVLFDQRGAGRSTPYAETCANTTAHLVADMERLRDHLSIERWLVFGGSWGATLALAYGQAQPERCAGFILRGVFLFRQREVEWFLNGMGTFFPEAHRAFLEFLPQAERGNLLAAYHARLQSSDPDIHTPAATAWNAYEIACSRLIPEKDRYQDGSLSVARLEAHYMAHSGFLVEGQLLTNLAVISHLPVEIVQGRYDVICPIVTAEELARSWPGARLTVVPDGGHMAMDTGIRPALVAATERFKALFIK
ncbi:MAG: prolyl aminopeptidase [Alphaproteobacteria bacterium RIFOXYD12_FULL_60_8]|nr:MAG: prolyl aminopeptidase [Alphaproteobacteria bacterium RIFOXYD12_FULL_60_8]